MSNWQRLTTLTDSDLDQTDPLELNLLIAEGVASLANLDIASYQVRADAWATDLRDRLRAAESAFRRTPEDWKNDFGFFQLGVLCWFVDEVLGIRYREDQRDLRSVFYTDPGDLFLSGVMDTRRGTCANMGALHVALGWRLGWPVSLACAGAHVFCRYDDGRITHNIEATNNGRGGFHSHPDAYYREQYSVSEEAVQLGSDLRALRPRELLGLFLGFRARYRHDSGDAEGAIEDYRRALEHFPYSRLLRTQLAELSVWTSVACGG